MPTPEESIPDQPKHQYGTIPLIEEQALLSKEVVESGRVRIAKVVREEPQSLQVPLTHEEVNVERVPVNQFVDVAPPAVRYEGETMIMPVVQEVVVKRLLVVEEIRVTKRQVQTTEAVQVTLLKEDIVVERTDLRAGAAPTAPDNPAPQPTR
ncbi:YsnF/AvaK domain-containing protein [Hymenobacter sp. BT175]|uniref:YsnF/AvaK domain-containing protein n=1 Tax=Hymenobacter translucens TaxID=2886507 RepID=UPI001D0E74EF|nr:YsnF/AvaK domain-containing protein [Hymenobacter translucens]MCC2546774.1 YsnF/AvaK domain-containing protein [Hymenobacter translucens]